MDVIIDALQMLISAPTALGLKKGDSKEVSQWR
jgi:hypothetical protein